MKDEIVEQVIDKYHIRSQVGVKKYNTTLEINNKDNYLKHLQEELMDATLYIQKLMDQNREITEIVRDTPNNTELGARIRKLIS
jgi:peptidoglycan hydrolase CwlO-like protein